MDFFKNIIVIITIYQYCAKTHFKLTESPHAQKTTIYLHQALISILVEAPDSKQIAWSKLRYNC